MAAAIRKASPGLAVAAAAGASATKDPLLTSTEAVKAQKILDEVWSSIQTREKIIPSKLLPFVLPQEFEKNFAKFGSRFLKLLKHTEYLKRVRVAVERAAKSLGSTIGAFEGLAITRFNVAACQEFATLIRFKAHMVGIRCPYMVVSNNVLSPSTHNHLFVMIGKKVDLLKDVEKNRPAITRGDYVLDILQNFGSQVIVDGFLHNKVIAAKDVMHCDELVSYFKAINITKFHLGRAMECTEEEAAEAFKQAEIIYSLALTILPNVPPQHPESHKAIQENEPHYCAELLGDKIPNTKWSKNAKAQKVWFEGTEDKAKEIAEYLNAHGIQATVAATAKSTHLAMIANPDFDLIEKLPPFEQWLKEKASKAKEATQAAPKEGKQEVVEAASKKKKKKKGKS